MTNWTDEIDRRISKIQNKVRNGLYEDFPVEYDFENPELSNDIWHIVDVATDAVREEMRQEYQLPERISGIRHRNLNEQKKEKETFNIKITYIDPSDNCEATYYIDVDAYSLSQARNYVETHLEELGLDNLEIISIW